MQNVYAEDSHLRLELWGDWRSLQWWPGRRCMSPTGKVWGWQTDLQPKQVSYHEASSSMHSLTVKNKQICSERSMHAAGQELRADISMFLEDPHLQTASGRAPCVQGHCRCATDSAQRTWTARRGWRLRRLPEQGTGWDSPRNLAFAHRIVQIALFLTVKSSCT